MYEELTAPIPQVEKYLQRLGISGSVSLDEAGLSSLVRAHLTHIPFDDMDNWGFGSCPSLEVDRLFDKIVIKGRGGYCFELNSLFCALLRTLGFDAGMAVASVVEGRGFPAPPSHCIVVCRIGEKKYFCDVGFGSKIPFGAIEMDGQEHYGYRVTRDGHHCTLERMDDTPVGPVIVFVDVPLHPAELLPVNYYISQKPDSPFRATLLVNQRLEGGGAYSINGKYFKIHRPGGSTEREMQNIDELKEILSEYFHMDPATLRLRDEL